MSRNGSGSYAVPNTFVSGTTITASDHNENWDDIEAEMTNSVAADGQTSMTGPLKASSGTLANPSLTFASDTDTGRYRKASNTMADVVGGVEVVEISSTGIAVTGSVDATTVKQGGVQLIPAGLGPLPYAGATAPDGWLFCYGQAISRTTYAALFAAISTVYGAGDGSTTFNLPDGRGRVVAGKDDMGGSSANRLTNQSGGLNGDTLGATGGSETVTIAQANLPAVTLTTTITDPGHGHSAGVSVFTASGSTQVGSPAGSPTAWIGTNTTGITASTALGGSGTATNIVQPTIIANYIIKY